MFYKYIILGLFTKTIASFDDFLTRIPLIASLTRTRKDKIAFSIGNFLAVLLVIVISIIFAWVLSSFAYTKIISAGLIFILAGLVYFDVFKAKKSSKIEKKVIKKVSLQKFFQTILAGFIVAFVTLIDDSIVFAGLFVNLNFYLKLAVASGIIIATILQIILVIYFSEKLYKLKYKKEIAILGLLILGILILFNII
ncbi:MAG: hypothetical protein GF365_01380|nr:hypothetical protein [Candidatus Buchananbacteria bacterium]